MYSQLKVTFVATALALALSGCAAKEPQPLMTESDAAVQELNEAALRVARAAEQASLAQTVRNRQNRVTQELKIDLSRVSPEMRAPLLLEGGFNGELEIFLKSVANTVGWPAPVIMGSRPTTPLMVAFTEQRRPPVLWIADAGYQAGESADIRINTSLRQIIIAYKETQGGQRFSAPSR
ncbi:DotD/TraH family lipoprotein [Pseudomonas sp. RP23018S]|uniref:DotD/TraH family lipoprotein n=1 Tax=Pseudomonas sp. RP23018S TaxID=3096037 RepID=UPI002ACAD05C|nr:DotD/TraH family lipoprotein [Pseudomonas sp. RP23018S]MDZ5605215.1 DotD/TraH family lipoprotein [Pseudomonas sp. RP23018S]